MPNTRHRQLALFLTSTLVIGVLAMISIPGLGRAQEATPAQLSSEQESELVAAGEEFYGRTCIACHQAGGAGAESDIAFTSYPALNDNAFVTVEDPTALVQTVLYGRGGMPSFRGLSDKELAGVVSYVRQAWDNDAAAVSPELVAEIRAERDVPPEEPATPFPTESTGAGTSEPGGTPPGIQDPEAPREGTPGADDGN